MDFGDTTLVVGGSGETGVTEFAGILEWDPEAEQWLERDEVMAGPKDGLCAILVDESTVNCQQKISKK